MSPFRYRDDDSSSGILLGAIVGAVAGFAAGMLLAQNAGGMERKKVKGHDEHATLEERIRDARGVSEEEDLEEEDEYAADEIEDDEELDEEGFDATLEERVLEAFRNDPILSARAVDIGSLRTGVIELAGVVETAEEAQHAVTIARGVPGVESVVNRIVTGVHEPRYQEAGRARRRAASRDVERSIADRPLRGDMAAESAPPNEVVRGDQPPIEGEAR